MEHTRQRPSLAICGFSFRSAKQPVCSSQISHSSCVQVRVCQDIDDPWDPFLNSKLCKSAQTSQLVSDFDSHSHKPDFYSLTHVCIQHSLSHGTFPHVFAFPVPSGLDYLWRVALECNRPETSKRPTYEEASDQLLKLYGSPYLSADRPAYIAAFVKCVPLKQAISHLVMYTPTLPANAIRQLNHELLFGTTMKSSQTTFLAQ